MTYEEMTAKAAKMTTEQLKDAQFINNMIDRWQEDDRRWNYVITSELIRRNTK